MDADERNHLDDVGTDARLPVRSGTVGSTPWSTPMGRRAFLLGAGAASLVAASPLPERLLRSGIAVALVEQDGLLVAMLYRPEDQLRLRFELPGLDHDPVTNQLVASGVGTPYVRIVHAAQHLAEQPVAVGATPGTAPIDHRTGGTSRLVYEVVPPIPFTVSALLSLAGEDLVTTTAAGDPADDVTMIEVPADLRLSPGATDPVSDVAPVTFGDVTQLHRTILTADGPIEITPVHNARVTDGFADRVPSAGQRDGIVTAAAANGPATADRLWLTPHGAWADLRASWPSLNWTQNVVGGRDQFVEIVEPGVLMPFGIPVAWITTTMREWQVDSGGGVVAALVVSTQVVIVDDTVTYDEQVLPYEGRAWPFREVSIVDEGPLEVLKEQIVLTDSTVVDDSLAWKMVQETAYGPYRRSFSYSAVDLLGNSVAFSLPGVFVTAAGTVDLTVRDQIDDFYRNGSESAGDLDGYTRVRVGVDPVAWAPEEEAGSGRTTLSAIDVWVRLDAAPDVPDASPVGLAPTVDRATVITPAEIQQGLGDVRATTLEVSYPPRWLDHGADPGTPEAPKNPDLGFLDVATPPTVALGGQARAVMTPDVVAATLNQEFGFGPLPDLDAVGPPTWSPAEAFGELAQILKGVKLADLVDPVDLIGAIPGIDVPGLTVSLLPAGVPEKIEYVYEWCPDEIASVPAAGFVATADTRLCVRMTTVVGLDPSVTSGGGVEFEVSDFTLEVPPLFPVVEIDVAELRAEQPIGGSFELTFDIAGWRLGGLLSWLEPLVDGLSPLGDAFDVDVGDESIELDLTLPLPNVDLGLLSIRNFSVGLGGQFPFTGPDEPLVQFNVGTRKAPISVSLLQFTGSFSCELDFTAQGLDRVRAKVEVEATLFQVDVVIAKASFTVGVLLDFRLTDGDVTFIGEVFVEASFSVLGITATVTVAATVTYTSATETAVATGEIRWEVSSFLGSADGTIPLGRLEFELGGGSSGAAVQGLRRATKRAVRADLASSEPLPTGRGFGDQHDFTTWTAYRSAFALA